MAAETLRQIFDAVYLLMLGAWGGAGVLVLLLLGPPRPERGNDLEWARHVLRRFYQLGATCGALALPAAVCARLAFPEYRTPWFALQSLCLIGATLPMFGGAARLARSDGPEPAPAIPVIRSRLAILLVLLAALAMTQALRPAPRTRGIIEPSPGTLSAPNRPSLPSAAGETPRAGLH